jgi:hypothetical protein
MPFDLSQENVETYCKVFDGVYVVTEYHRPGFSLQTPRLSNRGFIFEADNKKNGKHLMMSGIPGDECIPKVQAIEKDTGLKLKKIVCSGDFHHMAVKYWLDTYPEVQMVHSKIRFPQTRNGQEIFANEDYKRRIELVEGPTFPSLEEEYGDIVEFYGFNQFLMYDDNKQKWAAKNKNEPAKLGGPISMIKNMSKLKNDQPFLCVWFYHKASKDLVIDHNFDMCLSKDQINQAQSFLIRMSSKVNNFSSNALAPMPCAPCERDACRLHCEQMAPILDLDVLGVLDYHTDLKTHIRTYENKDEFKKEFTKVLKKTGEHDPTGEALFAVKNKSGCVIS